MDRRALAVSIVPVLALGFLVIKAPPVSWTLLPTLGLILLVVGAVGLTLSRIQLGNSFSVRPEARALVTQGIYSKIRNPIYVFAAIVIAGLLLYINCLQWFWIFLIIIPLQIFRARKESQVLEEKFGDTYRQYKAQTWF